VTRAKVRKLPGSANSNCGHQGGQRHADGSKASGR
jgi:hypothetical protein